jgi:betaine reductase
LVKQIDDAGIPVVHLCTIVPISKAVGANRIYAAVAIPHPAGYPKLSREEEFEARVRLCQKAIGTTAIEVTEQTIFGKDI